MLAKAKPWTMGLYESIAAVDLLRRQRLEEKNRICLIILDSTLEIAFKEYLVHDSGRHYNNSSLRQMFNKRSGVHDVVKKQNVLPKTVWPKIQYYYDLRCKMVHERATVGITDVQIEDFREIVQNVLEKLFGLKFPQ